MSILSQLVPLVVLVLALAVAAFIGYAIYTIATDIANKTSNKMEKKNIKFGKEGMKIGVKEVKTENYVDQTQNLLVKAWNYSTWPAYKSRFWNKEENGQPSSGSSSSSSQQSARQSSVIYPVPKSKMLDGP